jgi:E3 ubiquitin-protein ligase XBAT32/33
MGNALGCAGLGERLAAGARDGDAAEVRRLLDANPGLARCAAFGSLSSPLHLAAAKGHHEVRGHRVGRWCSTTAAACSATK